MIVQAPPGTSFDAGAAVGLTVAPAKTYLFDAETGGPTSPASAITTGMTITTTGAAALRVVGEDDLDVGGLGRRAHRRARSPSR